jgi:hypothetical protein
MSKRNLVLLGFILLKFILQYTFIIAEYDLQRDEYLHLDQANHLAWGYLSVPPFTSWIAWVIKILGNGVFWIKFFPALFGALTLLIVWKTIEALNGNLMALILGATCILFSALLRLNILFQPNSFDVLSWALVYFTAVQYFTTEKPKWLYAGALAFAFGFLNKYNIAFLLVGFIPALFITNQRIVFLKKELYVAATLGLLLILPNLIWQYQNNFPVFYHLNQLAETQLVNVNRLDFLKNQLIFFIGALPVIVCAWYALLFYEPFSKYKVFFWSFIFTIAVFTYLRAKDYYAIGLYPIYIAFGSVYVQHLTQMSWKKYFNYAALLFPLILFVPLYRIGFPNKSPKEIVAKPETYKALGLLRWEDGKDHALPQDFADMLGWRELAQKVDSVYLSMGSTVETLVLCDNYGQAGAINYYTKQGVRAVSFNADYIDWFDLSKPYKHLIRVKEHTERGEELKETSPYFEYAAAADSVTNPYAREHGTTLFVFKNARININERIQQEIDELTSQRSN